MLLPQACLCSGNPGDTEECIQGSDRPHRRDGERVCAKLPGEPEPAQSPGSFCLVFLVQVGAREGGGAGPGSPRPVRAALPGPRGPSMHTTTACQGPSHKRGGGGLQHQPNRGCGGHPRLHAHPQALTKAREEPGSPRPAPAAALALATLVPSSPDPQRQQQWKEESPEHRRTLRFHSRRAAAPPRGPRWALKSGPGALPRPSWEKEVLPPPRGLPDKAGRRRGRMLDGTSVLEDGLVGLVHVL